MPKRKAEAPSTAPSSSKRKAEPPAVAPKSTKRKPKSRLIAQEAARRSLVVRRGSTVEAPADDLGFALPSSASPEDEDGGEILAGEAIEDGRVVKRSLALEVVVPVSEALDQRRGILPTQDEMDEEGGVAIMGDEQQAVDSGDGRADEGGVSVEQGAVDDEDVKQGQLAGSEEAERKVDAYEEYDGAEIELRDASPAPVQQAREAVPPAEGSSVAVEADETTLPQPTNHAIAHEHHLTVVEMPIDAIPESAAATSALGAPTKPSSNETSSSLVELSGTTRSKKTSGSAKVAAAKDLPPYEERWAKKSQRAKRNSRSVKNKRAFKAEKEKEAV